MNIARTLLLATFGVLIAVSTAKATTLVTLKSASDVTDQMVRLSDVFDGVPHDSDRTIATAPAPGKSVTYDVRILMRLAEQYRLDWQPQGTSDHTLIHRASTHISQDMIRAAVLSKLTSPELKPKINGKIEVVFDNHAPELDLPADRKPDFTLKNFAYDAQDKKFHADLVTEGGSEALTLPLSGKVHIKREIAVFSRKIEAGTVLAAPDLDWILMPEEKITPDMITDATEALGRELRRDNQEGLPLRARDLTAPRLVLRGALVTLKVETPYLLITAQGRALQDGAIGDVVRVTNTQSNRVVEGTVISSGVIRVATTLQALQPKTTM